MSAPGDIQVAGEVDDWSFFGRAGQSVDVFLHTGGGGKPAPIPPALDYGQVTLLDPDGNQIAIASNSQSGADASIVNEVLTTDGTYQIEVQAAPGHFASLGNYVIAAYDAGTYTSFVDLNQAVYGQLNSPYSQDRWTFSATANTQVQLNLIASANPSLQFSLTGPDGFTGFSGLSTSSDLVTLPTSGTYVLDLTTSQSAAGGGAYGFRLNQTTLTDLTLGTANQGTLIGSEEAQLFQIAVPQAQGLLVVLQDSVNSDRNELYLKLGAPPTRSDYQYRFSTLAAASQQILVPWAAAGTWYALLYSTSVPQPGSYTVLATTGDILLTGSTSNRSGTSADTTLTLTGWGFDQATSVALVAADGTVYPASTTSIDLPTQITATFAAGTVPAGVYSIEASKPGVQPAVLSNALTIDQGGARNLKTDIVLPSSMGYHAPATIYVDYANTGDIAMPAPLLTLGGSNNRPLLTLDQSLVVPGLWTSLVLPQGFGNSVELLGSGATPGVLQPGETMRVPVYYDGQEAPWTSVSSFIFNLTVTNSNDTTPIDWSSIESGLRPRGIDETTWAALYPGLTEQIGSTWGDFVAKIDADASYLGRLGETVTDVAQLWQFEIRQAIGLNPVSQIASNVDVSVSAPGLPLTFSRSYSPSILDRSVIGPLGMGWSLDGGWQRTLTKLSDGTVVVADAGGAIRTFQPDSRSSNYFDQPGDHGVLIANADGTFSLRETNGALTHFLASGQVDYVQDTNGNRVTAGYSGGLLTSLNHSDGQSIEIAYNAADLISQVTDPFGRQTTFTYDAANQHLVSVQEFDGSTYAYTYDTGAGPTINTPTLLSCLLSSEWFTLAAQEGSQ